MAAKLEEPECVLEIGGTKFLMPQEQATQVFKLLHGATWITENYDDAYKNIGWKYHPGKLEVTLRQAEPNLRAKLVLGE